MMDLLTIEETKQRLGISDSTLRRWVRKGKIKAQKIEHRYYFHAQDVDRLLPKQKDTDASSQRLGNVESTIETLHQEIASLRQEVEELKASMLLEASQRAEKDVAASTSSASPYDHERK